MVAVALIVAGCTAPERADPAQTETTDDVREGDALPSAPADHIAADEAPPPDVRPTDVLPLDVLSADGWGPLRIGMTRAEVEAAVGGPANPDLVGGPEPEICDEFQPARAPDGMLLMIERDTLTRITLIREATLRTTAGAGLGDEESEVVAAHGGGAEVTPHKYLPPPAAYVTVREVGPSERGFVYATHTDRRVTHIHAGGPSIHYVEGCL